ncbi:MAG: class I SAM-dependent methyltransferase, partial [Candidatus Tumulicola sp.]
DTVSEFDDLSPIYHYWSNTFVRAMLERVGCHSAPTFLAKFLRESARRCGARSPVFLSIGSGGGTNEVEIAQLLQAGGLSDFRIDCLELNPTLIKRAAGDARTAGLSSHLHFLRGDFNKWRPRRSYQGVVANQSLHHVTNLEGLFDAVRDALAPGAFFVANDVIGRNGHQRWPEAQHIVERFWPKLDRPHRFHHQFRRYEERFTDWDCSTVGFEGIRAQDVLPLLVERFSFHVFVGYGNVIDPFVDRGLGPNFDAGARWDRTFIDCLHACDERALLEGILTPTHMMAVMATDPAVSPYYARDLTPQACVRDPARVVTSANLDAIDRALSMYFDVPPVERYDGIDVVLPLIGCVMQSGPVAGAYSDGWAGAKLEFSVVPDRDISRFTAHATIPQDVPEDTELRITVDGGLVAVARGAGAVRLDCPRLLPRGRVAKIAFAAGATVNLKQLGLGEDERELGLHLDDVIFEP